MTHPGPFGGDDPDNPFAGMPFFGDLARMLRSQGPVSWDAARQFATSVATGGTPEANVEPLQRIRYEELARVAELRVQAATGLPTSVASRPVTVLPVTRSEWARRTLDAWRPLLERLATTLSAQPSAEDEGGTDPAAQLLGGLFQMIGPVMLGMQSGAMVGHLATRALGQYDLPVPRPPSDELLVVAANVDAFADGWSLPGDDLRLWVCLSEVTHHAVLGRPHVRARLDALLQEYASGFRVDAGALEQRLGEVDPADPSSLQSVLGDPEALLGVVRSSTQEQMLPQLDALVAVVAGYVDHVMDSVGEHLVGSYGMITEALRRRRVEAGTADRFVEHLLGVELGRAQYERGTAFVDGVVERAGADALGRLWAEERDLPTPAEVDAPGLWLARIDLEQ